MKGALQDPFSEAEEGGGSSPMEAQEELPPDDSGERGADDSEDSALPGCTRTLGGSTLALHLWV